MDLPDSVRPALLPDRSLETSFPEVVEVQAEDCLVDPSNGAVYLPESGAVLGESYGSYYRALNWGRLRRASRKPRSEAELAGRTVIPMPDTGYYHWLIEVLPSVLHAVSVAEAPILLISDAAKPYVAQAAQVLGVPVHVAKGDGMLAVDRVIFTSRPPVSGETHPHNLRLLADLGVRLNRGERLVTERIFISRRLDPARWTPTQYRLESLAASLGYDVVIAQELSWTEQVELVASCRSLAGLHGAGLANLVFGTPTMKLIEVFPGEMRNWCYFRAARSLGIQYSAHSDSNVPSEELLASLLAGGGTPS